MDSLEEFLARLDEAGIDLTEREVKDALWLAVHMAGPSEVWLEPTQSHEPVVQESPVITPPAGMRVVNSPRRRVPLSYSAAATRDKAGPGHDLLPIHMPESRALRRTLDLQRALRSLTRTVNAGSATVLDEEKTVANSADADAVIPVLTRSSERWFNLTLIVDTSPSMVLWDTLIAEVHLLLTQLGAFRTIRTRYLRFDRGKAAISQKASTGAPRSPREIVDPTGRTATLVITDCVGEPWKFGSAMEALATWGRTGPLAILQPLPQRMWQRSAVPCHYLQLRSPQIGAPNLRLAVENPDVDRVNSALPDKRHRGMPVPILEITPGWFAAWSRLVTGTGRTYAMAAFTGASEASDVEAGSWARNGARTLARAHEARVPAHVPEGAEPERIVTRFMAGASAEAFKLAGFLAAAPVSLPLPLMRLIQQVTLPDTRPPHLAEVYLGGLLHPAAAPGREAASAPARLEFLPGVRDVLLGTIRRSEAIRVMELVSAVLSRPRNGVRTDIMAMVGGDPSAAVDRLSISDRPYSQVEEQVLRRIGGRYAELAVSTSAASALAHRDTPVIQAPRTPVPPQRPPGFRIPSPVQTPPRTETPHQTPTPPPAETPPQTPSLSQAGTRPAAQIPTPETQSPPQAQPQPQPHTQTPSSALPSDPLPRPYDLIKLRRRPDKDRPGPGIAMWGAPGSGKTTFLAALSLDLNRRRRDTGWRVVGADQTSEEELIKLTTSLASRRDFPAGTFAIDRFSWALEGQVTRAVRKRFRIKYRDEQVRIPLDLADASGEIAGPTSLGLGIRDELLDHLASSRGIVFMFDPVREFERGDAFDYSFGMVVQLARRVAQAWGASPGALPHYVAVCVTKFDDLRVLRTARELGLTSVDPADPYEFPRVDDDDARELFAQLGEISSSGNADMVPNLLDQYFRPERIRYFVTSAIGFYVDPRIRVYDPDDPENVLPHEHDLGNYRIRGAVHPINVVEPLLWLGSKLSTDG